MFFGCLSFKRDDARDSRGRKEEEREKDKTRRKERVILIQGREMHRIGVIDRERVLMHQEDI